MRNRVATDEWAGPADAEDLPRLQFQSVPQTVVEKIQRAILRGRLKPGERLVEQKLAASLGIGQPTLREALKELEHQGFVRKIPKRGTYVTKLTLEDFRKILEVRMALEALAVEKAALNMTEKAAKELRRTVSLMETAAARFDLAAFHANDLAFHRRLWALSGNEYLAGALERVAFALFAFVLLQRKSESVNEFVDSAEQHRQIVDGLCSGDSAIARKTFIQSTLHFWNQHHRLNIGVEDAPVASFEQNETEDKRG